MRRLPPPPGIQRTRLLPLCGSSLFKATTTQNHLLTPLSQPAEVSRDFNLCMHHAFASSYQLGTKTRDVRDGVKKAMLVFKYRINADSEFQLEKVMGTMWRSSAYPTFQRQMNVSSEVFIERSLIIKSRSMDSLVLPLSNATSLVKRIA